jgi:translation initiation factor 2B subunit (eIF-2B alpha/beta/delta family)
MMNEGSKEITLDWEHTEYRFITPDDLKDYDTVPNLEFGMKRCFVGPETEKSLNALRSDHESGAQALAVLALNMLLKAVQGSDFSPAAVRDPKQFWKELRMIAWHLAKNGRPSMGAAIEASLFRALDTIRQYVDNLIPPESEGVAGFDLASFKEFAEPAIRKQIAAREASLVLLSGKFLDFFVQDGDKMKESSWPSSTTIVTLSSSGTIRQCLLDLVWSFVSTERSLTLCILESRPKFEGAAFANSLLDGLQGLRPQGRYQGFNPILKNLKIEIVSDASAATVVEHADYLLLGADKVLSSGNTSNKIGSLTAAVMAKTLNPTCKVVAVFETDKITGSSDGADHFKVEYNDEGEVISVWPTSVVTGLAKNRKEGYRIVVKNAYFEWVPSKYIDEYITEQGRLGIEDIRKLSVESEELEKTLFADV